MHHSEFFTDVFSYKSIPSQSDARVAPGGRRGGQKVTLLQGCGLDITADNSTLMLSSSE